MVFFDEFDNSGTDSVKIFNNASGSGLIRRMNVPGDLEGDDFNKWDMLFFKSGSNYYMNIWQSRALDGNIGQRYMFAPTLLPVSDGTPTPNGGSLINLGTSWPTGSFFGAIGLTGGLNAFHFVNNFTFKSGFLLPDTYVSSLTAGPFPGGFQ
jgi:hypothetical protein